MTVDHPVDPGLVWFNALDDAERALLACCAAPRWAREVAAGRPYPDRTALADRARAILDGLEWSEIRTALDAHPRIGERPTGAGVEAAWSRTEQSGMDAASTETKTALVEANRAYEQRFGHVLLIFATGRTDIEMLDAARRRLGNDETTERGVVRAELARIVALRLERLLDS
jgi:2-oxo-4-hydroxy-4-carboxy-5-ureidoimidazoline decarboxylase